jgi:hypothetical protein
VLSAAIGEGFRPDCLRIYDSETNEYEKAAAFKNATNAWSEGVIAVIYTSTMAAGITAPIARFEQQFGFFSTSTSCEAEMQMLTRFRLAKKITVAVQPADRQRVVQGAGRDTRKPKVNPADVRAHD